MQTAEIERPTDPMGWAKLLQDLKSRRRRFRQFAGAMFVLWMTIVGRPIPLALGVGAGLVVLGMLVRLCASGFVIKNEVLATVGPYARVRHPLYVGNILICIGFCLASGLWWSWIVAVVLLALFYPPAIEYEDRKLQRLFPGEWDRWAAEVRALVPRLRPYAGGAQAGEARWSLKLSMLRNGEPIHIAVIAGCLAFLYWRMG
jgi:hypothetical protein